MATKINISEIFYSLQGEGPNTGKPSIFVRLAGCNLTCGFCDAWYTWNWIGTDFKHKFAPKADPSKEIATYESAEFIKIFLNILSKNKCSHVVLTGGEPLSQQKAIEDFFKLLEQKIEKINWPEFEIETNGTIIPSADISRHIKYFSVSPKFANSGNALKLREREKVLTYFANNNRAIFKFVIDAEEDMKEVEYLRNKYHIPKNKIYLMPQGVSEQEVRDKGRIVAEICKKDGSYIYCHRLQSTLWDATRGV